MCHPDTRMAYIKRQSANVKKHLCKWGTPIYKCPYSSPDTPISLVTGKHIRNATGRICKTCKDDCPAIWSAEINGNKQKKFGITSRHYRELSNRMAYLKENAQNKVLFITLTFGEYKNEEITEQQANECFSTFIDRLLKEHKRGNYIAVRERGDNNTKRLHFHSAIELPFVPFGVLNSLWNSCISKYCYNSGRAVYTDPKARFIRTTTSAVRYMCKYISKSIGTKSDTRVIFVSREVAQARIKMRMSPEQLIELKQKYSCLRAEKINDYITTYTIKYSKHDTEQYKKRAVWQMNNLFYTFVRQMFGTTDTKPQVLYHFGTD